MSSTIKQKKPKDKLDRFKTKLIKVQNVSEVNNKNRKKHIIDFSDENELEDELRSEDPILQEMQLVERNLSNIVSKLKIASKYKKSTYAILEDLVQYSLGYDSALETIKVETYNTIVSLSDLKFITNVKRKVLELKYLSSSIMASGLGSFHDEIVLLHIQKLFGSSELPKDFKNRLEQIKKERLEQPLTFPSSNPK